MQDKRKINPYYKYHHSFNGMALDLSCSIINVDPFDECNANGAEKWYEPIVDGQNSTSFGESIINSRGIPVSVESQLLSCVFDMAITFVTHNDECYITSKYCNQHTNKEQQTYFSAKLHMKNVIYSNRNIINKCRLYLYGRSKKVQQRSTYGNL